MLRIVLTSFYYFPLVWQNTKVNRGILIYNHPTFLRVVKHAHTNFLHSFAISLQALRECTRSASITLIQFYADTIGRLIR